MRELKEFKSEIKDTPVDKLLQRKEARVRNFGNSNKVEIKFDYNRYAKEDRMFKIRVDNKEAILNVPELQKIMKLI